MSTQATPTKLRSGDWGAKTSTGSKGQVADLTVTTRAGKSWVATHRCIAAGDGWALWAKEQASNGGYRARHVCDDECRYDAETDCPRRYDTRPQRCTGRMTCQCDTCE